MNPETPCQRTCCPVGFPSWVPRSRHIEKKDQIARFAGRRRHLHRFRDDRIRDDQILDKQKRENGHVEHEGDRQRGRRQVYLHRSGRGNHEITVIMHSSMPNALQKVVLFALKLSTKTYVSAELFLTISFFFASFRSGVLIPLLRLYPLAPSVRMWHSAMSLGMALSAPTSNYGAAGRKICRYVRHQGKLPRVVWTPQALHHG
jgi:hypothetical protein